VRRCPIVVVCFSMILVSLIGLPPFAGFAGKVMIFYYLVEAQLWTVLVIAGLNTALSLYYYLRVVRIMTIEPEPENRRPISLSFIPGAFVVALTVPVFVFGIWFNGLNELARSAARHLF
jgi:NADH-quinone oxidoreductase subunit N